MAAAVSISSNTYTRIYSDLTGLTYPDVDYDAFKFDLYYWDGDIWDFVETTGEISVNDATFITSPGFTYYVNGFAQYSSTWYDVGNSSQLALSLIPAPTISSASVTNQNIIFTAATPVGTRLTQWWGSTDNTNYQWWTIADIKGDAMYGPGHNYFTFNYTTSSDQITFINLPDNQVQYYACFQSIDGYYSVSSENVASQGYLSYTTYYNASVLSSNVISNITDVSFKSTATGISGGAYDIIDWAWDEHGTGYANTHSHASPVYYTISSLSSNTAYDVRVRLRNTTSGYTSGWKYAYPTTLITRPTNWAWTSTVVQGGAITLVNATKKITILTAAEWNAFTGRINDFREYKTVADYSFTTVVAGNAALYSQANEARSAISTLSPPTTLPAAVSQYGKVTAAFINGLKNSLNSIA